MKKGNFNLCVFFLSTLFLLGHSAASQLHASAFQNPPAGTTAGGRAGAFVAGANDASAVLHNPAALVTLESNAFLLAPTIVHPRTTYTGPGGEKDTVSGKVPFLPNIFLLAGPGGSDRWRVGLGVTTPWGMSVGWSDDGPLRYALTDSSLKTLQVNPVFAWRPGPPGLSLAVGANYLRSEIEEKVRLDLTGMGLPDGRGTMDLSGEGWGLNLALRQETGPGQVLALTYRGRVSVSHRGKSASDPPMPVDPATTLKMNFPASAAAAWSFSPSPDWLVETSLEWVQWSSLEDNRLNSPLGEFRPYEGWRDTWSPRLGATCALSKNWRGHAGLAWLPSPVPDRHFHPRIPGADAVVLSLGADWGRNNLRLGVSQSLSLPRKRTVQGSENHDGTYRFLNHILNLSLQYDF